MKRAAQTVNAGLPLAAAVLPDVVGVDLAATTRRITAWGGQPAIYAWSLSQVNLTPLNARSIATVAGWRAGVVGLRDSALELIPTLDGAAAVLGLAASELEGFLEGQVTDPFAWPRQLDVVATVGGFRGLGGPWLTPPTAAVTAARGEFLISTGPERWKVIADIFGARVIRTDDLDDVHEQTSGASVGALFSADSYLVRLEHR